jgi:predicted DCC family thiol-disulfide oxidoreductase YuxK
LGEQVLLYDGLCGFCDGFVQFVLRRDKLGTMRFATLQGEYARQVLGRHPGLHGVDAVVLVESPGTANERVLVRSEAALGVADYIGGIWGTASVFRIVPGFIRDAAYDLFASVRYTIFGRYSTCPVPTATQRARFAD